MNFKHIFTLCLTASLSGLFAQNYQLKNLDMINSEYLDFSPIRYKQGILFTSTRDNSCKCKDKRTDDNYTNLYYGDINSGKVTELMGDVNGRHHDGVAALSNNTTLYFTRTNKLGKSRTGIKDLKIYKLKYDNGEWLNDGELPFNSKEFATAHPTLSADGQKLYFSSNRPGTIGGMDLWMSTKEKNGNWGQPVNLGANINTKGNEVFPFLSENNELFFSSDGHEGSQKLDIYKVNLSDLSNVTKLNETINSPYDDFGYAEYENGTYGYVSSNRPGGKGGDDIYVFKKQNMALPKCKIIAIDASTQQMITMPSIAATANHITLSNSDDFLNLTPDKDQTYTILVSKAGYQPKEIKILGLELASMPEYKVPLTKLLPNKSISKLMIKSKANQQLVPNASVKIEKQCGNNAAETIISNTGESDITLECNCNYKLTVMKDGFMEQSKSFQSPSCDQATTMTQVIELEPIKTFEGTEIKKGAVITLKDIYYDYNKYNIRSDARVVLDKVVNLMNQYPSLEIELASHTDSRGNNQYNQTLSQNRAQSAVAYIVSRGVSASRLKAGGYGESQLTNHCADGVKCTEEEHQANRRTEVRVLKFEESNVNIIKE